MCIRDEILSKCFCLFLQWNIISKGFCCCSNKRFFGEDNLDLERDVTAHPSNSAIGLSAHAPLYPPGKMIHVVRSHVPSKRFAPCHFSFLLFSLFIWNGYSFMRCTQQVFSFYCVYRKRSAVNSVVLIGVYVWVYWFHVIVDDCKRCLMSCGGFSNSLLISWPWAHHFTITVWVNNFSRCLGQLEDAAAVQFQSEYWLMFNSG